METLKKLLTSIVRSWGAVAFKEGKKDYVAFVFDGDYLRTNSKPSTNGWTSLTPFDLSKTGKIVQLANGQKYFVRISVSIPPADQAPAKVVKTGVYTESFI